MSHKHIDMHCHPALKPYNKSFKYQPTKQNDLRAGRKNSIWHYSPPNLLERSVNKILTLTKFTQTDLTALAKSGCSEVIIALYPFEKHFFTRKVLGLKFITDLLVNLAAGISQKGVDHVRNHSNYFTVLEEEYDFYKQLDNQVQLINGVHYTYRIVNNYAEIRANNLLETPTKKIINIILSIEGGHSFNTGLDMLVDTANEAQVLENIQKIKQWDHTPAFVTLAHHFYNELCGHARSISIGAIKKNQNRGLNTDITNLGHKVINALLSSTNGKPIFIDIKHMSTPSRKTYYELLNRVYAQQNIPIIVSHGALNGKRSIEQWDVIDYPNRSHHFNDIDINFYDFEIKKIAASKGIFGMQLDERRIGSKRAVRKSKVYFPNRKKRLKKKSLLVWRQIEHIAEILNNDGLFCWGIQTIGSDFDGIVNPIKGIWTSENIEELASALVKHAEKYLDNETHLIKNDVINNKISAEEIIERVMHTNAINFLETHFK